MITERVTADMTAALKAGEQTKLDTLRLIVTSFKNEAIKLGHELSDDEALKVLVKEAKQRQDSIEAYSQGGRDDLASQESAELTLIEAYLPQAMSEAELAKLVEETIASLDHPQMGAVIGAVRAKAGPTADGGLIARLVKERL